MKIDRPASAVWAVVTDVDSHPRWRPALQEFRQTSPGPLQAGSTIHETIAWRGRGIGLDDVVTALEPERRLGMRGGWKAADFELDLLLAPRGTSTEVTFDWTFRPKTLLVRAAAPLLRGTLVRATRDELAGLKRYVEDGPPQASPS